MDHQEEKWISIYQSKEYKITGRQDGNKEKKLF
jgi:hypothetical protein